MRHWFSVDVGGTEIKYAVLNEQGEFLHHGKCDTPSGGEANILIPEAAARIVRELTVSFGKAQGVGISTAGVVDPDSGEIIFAGGTIPGYKGTNWKREIEGKLGLAVMVANDVNAAAVGEWWRGAARGVDSFFCMTLGTGIGGALFHEGKLVLGSHYRAGEIGHSLYDGATGTTYEQRASMSALLKLARRRLPGFSGDGHALFDAAKAGDMAAAAIIDGWTEEIARGIAGVIVLADPKLIVIGGGVSEQGDYLLEKISRHVASYLPPGFSQTELAAAQLGNKAALYGAVYPYYIEETEL